MCRSISLQKLSAYPTGGVLNGVDAYAQVATISGLRFQHTAPLEALLFQSPIRKSIGVDLGAMDPDRPLESFDSQAMTGLAYQLLKSAPPGTRTFRDLARANMSGQFLVGAAEQVADTLQSFGEAGIDGFNLV